MRETLHEWVSTVVVRDEARRLELVEQTPQLDDGDAPPHLVYQALLGELFSALREADRSHDDWSAIARGLIACAGELPSESQADAEQFAATAFYCGGFPASAAMVARNLRPEFDESTTSAANRLLLGRETIGDSARVAQISSFIAQGDLEKFDVLLAEQTARVEEALIEGPEPWIEQRLHVALLTELRRTNLRAALPEGISARWDPLVDSFLARRRPIWELFPSQIAAINEGLLGDSPSFAMQMPTGSGKTSLVETLIFDHLIARPTSLAVLLVPFRALARELRQSLGKHLTAMGMPTRTFYGGTVPTAAEEQDLEEVRVVIATPEAFTGLLGSQPQLTDRISLVVCDEGHLLDGPGRGVSLELLLARLRGISPRPRFVFASAIVPNIDSIAYWLGGDDRRVVRSEYRPTDIEFAVLRATDSGVNATVALEVHRPGVKEPAHTLSRFLSGDDFRFRNPETGRMKTYDWTSHKARAVAAGRRALPLGSVAVFAANKRGTQGAIGLTQELLNQLDEDLSLSVPRHASRDQTQLDVVADYLSREFGRQWLGTRAVTAGAAMHHGDIPQETREVLEELVSDGVAPMVFCTNTLAEGVNLPIRTMVLYSVHRSGGKSGPVPLLVRDIRNLVGRTGRAGSASRGLVICANDAQWNSVLRASGDAAGEPVEGALIALVRRLADVIMRDGVVLTNRNVEGTPELQQLVDGIDATLVELLSDELGTEQFAELARAVIDDTYAAATADESQVDLLRTVASLRAGRLIELRSRGRLAVLQGSGLRPRLVDAVLDDLRGGFAGWDTVESSADPEMIAAILGWALSRPEFSRSVTDSFGTEETDTAAAILQGVITRWLDGSTYSDIASAVGVDLNDLLRLHAKLIQFDLLTLVEQAVAILAWDAEESGTELAPAVRSLPESLRFGTTSPEAVELMLGGVRHRRAAIELASDSRVVFALLGFSWKSNVHDLLLNERALWLQKLGELVYSRTLEDVTN